MLGVKEIAELVNTTPKEKPHLYQSLLQDSNLIFSGFDELLAEKGMGKISYSGFSRTVNLNVVDGLYFEMLQKWMLPFGVQPT